MVITPRCPNCDSKGMYYRKKSASYYCKFCNTTSSQSQVREANLLIGKSNKDTLAIEKDSKYCMIQIIMKQRELFKLSEEYRMRMLSEGYTQEDILELYKNDINK